VLIAIAAAAGAQIALGQLREATERNARIRDERLALAQLMSLFKDLETGARGFALTGEHEYLDPYDNARAVLHARYADTRSVLHDEGFTDFSWDILDALVDERIRLAREVVDERRKLGRGIVNAQALFDEGKATMDHIRLLAEQLDGELLGQAGEINRRVAETRRNAMLLGWGAMLAVGGLIAVSILLLHLERLARQRLERALRQSNEQLETRVAARTAELSAARARIASFAAEQEQSVEGERRRIAREVHDQLGAVFTGIRLILRSLPAGAVPAESAQALADAADMGASTARRIANELRPPLLDDLGLGPALTNLLERLFQNTETAVSVAVSGTETLSERQALGIYRIVQEAGTNVLRHAGARHFAVSGDLADDGYRLALRDDGVGLATHGGRQGALGLTGMRERAELLGGDLAVQDQTGAGTTLILHLPLSDEYQREDTAA
jgi:signal transduction histidine kinase